MTKLSKTKQIRKSMKWYLEIVWNLFCLFSVFLFSFSGLYHFSNKKKNKKANLKKFIIYLAQNLRIMILDWNLVCGVFF